MSSQGTESSQGANQQTEQERQFAEIFAHLPEQDIEQFYAHYQLWLLRRRVPVIEKQLELLHGYLSENQQLVKSLRPSAIALAVLVRLQSSGVTNIDVLDQMLERGEDWLDRMMQRLDYCEQVEDFIQGDYTQWCTRSLEGAYDWIDTVLGLGAPTAEAEVSYTSAPDINALEATEELLLQKLREDDDEGAREITLSQPTGATEDEREAVASEASEVSITEQQDGAPETSKVSIPAPEPAAYDAMEVGIAEEFLLAKEHVEETSESVEALKEAEWEKLENAEARPEPWYSVNLTADASPDAQPDMMQDWINVLQATEVPQAENSVPETTQISEETVSSPTESSISEITQVSTETPVIFTEPLAGASQAEDGEIEVEKASAEEMLAQAEEGEAGAMPRLAEVQGEPEMDAEGEVTLIAEEALREPEISVEDEVTPTLEEAQSELDVQAESDVASLAEELQSEPETRVEGALAENSPETKNISAEAVTEETLLEVEAYSGENAGVPEESEPTTEADSEPSPFPIVEEADVASNDKVEATRLPDVEREASDTTGEASAESDCVVEAVEEARAADSVELETATQASSMDVAAPLADAAVPDEAGVNAAASPVRITSPLEVDDTISWSYVPFEETTPGEESSNARPWYEYLEHNEQVAQMPQSWGGIEQPGALEESQSAISFDFVPQAPELSGGVSPEQHELSASVQELAEAAVQEAASGEPGEVAGADALEEASNESGTAATHPAASTLQEELERERVASQGAYPEIDATQPMVALKGKRRKKQSLSVEPEVPVGEIKEGRREVAEDAELEVPVSETQEESRTNVASPTGANEASEASAVGQGTPLSGDVSEMPTALIRNEMRSIQDEMRSIQDKVRSIQQNIREIPVTPVLREPEEMPVPQVQNEVPATHERMVVNEAAPSNEGTLFPEHGGALVENVEQPPEKVGFWRRLFGRKGKKK